MLPLLCGARDPALAGGGGNPSPTDIQLSASSIAFNAAADTAVGTVTVTDPGSSSWTFSVDNSKFRVDPSSGASCVLERSGTGSLTAGISETVNITADDGVSTPYNEAFTITVFDPAAEQDIVTMTVANTTAGAKTNECVLLPVPLAAAAVQTGHTLKVYNDNGSGAKGSVVGSFQIDGLSSDKYGKNRLAFIPLILPTLGPSDTDHNLFVVSSADSVPSGTAITAANLAGIAGMANGGVVVSYDIGGTVYTSRLDTILTASSTFSKTAAQLVQAYAGPSRTTWVGSMPPMNGGLPHASGDGLRTYMIIEAWKAGTGAFHATNNPITLITVDVWTENTDIVRTTPAHYWYGYKIERMTGIDDATLISSDDTDMDGNVIRYDYPRSAPSATLTLQPSLGSYSDVSGFTRTSATEGTFASNRSDTEFVVGRRVRASGSTTGTIYGAITASVFSAGVSTVTIAWDSGSMADEAITLGYATKNQYYDRSAGNWATDILGAYIVTSEFKAIVTQRVSNTRVKVYMCDPVVNVSLFNVLDPHPKSTTYTSGNWSIEGIGQHSNANIPPRRVYIGAKPTHIVAWGDVASAITADTRAPMDYLASTGLFLNNQVTFAAVTHSTTKIDAMRASDGSRRPGTFLGDSALFDMGELATVIGQSGWHDAIGPIPDWCVAALVKWSAAGRRRLFENAEYWSTWQFIWPRKSTSSTNGQAGVWPRADNGTTYRWDSRFAGTQIRLVGGGANDGTDDYPVGFWPYSGDTAHHSASCYIPYLLTGNLYWLMALQRQEAYANQAGDDSLNGVGNNKTPYGDADGTNSNTWGAGQTRACAWKFRDMLQTCICTPDSIDEKIINSKAYYQTRVDLTWTAGKQWGPDNTNGEYTGVDAVPAYIMANSDREGLSTRDDERIIASWQLGFNDLIMGAGHEMGLDTADGQALFQWRLRWQRDVHATSGALVRGIIARAYFSALSFDAQGQPTSCDDIYQRSCWLKPMNTVGDLDGSYFRTATGTVTINDNSVGAGKTMTFSNGATLFGQGSWYAGGFIRELSSGGVFLITSVSGNVLTGEILSLFSGLNPTASGLRIPGAHRLDYDGSSESVIGFQSIDYVQATVAAMRLGLDQGYFTTEFEEAITYETSRAGYNEVRSAWNIAPR